MRKDQRKIGIEVDVQATLSGMDKVVSEMQKKLKEGSITKIDASMSKGLTKQFEEFQSLSQKFVNLTKGNQVQVGDAKEAIKTGDQILKIFKAIQDTVGDFGSLSVDAAKKLFPDAFRTSVDEALKKIQRISGTVLDIQVKQDSLAAAQGKLDDLELKQQALEEEFQQKLNFKIDTTEAQNKLKAAEDKIQEIRDKLAETIGSQIKQIEDDRDSKITSKQKEYEGERAEYIKSKKLDASKLSYEGGRAKYEGKGIGAWQKAEAGTPELKEQKKAIVELLQMYNYHEDALKSFSKSFTEADEKVGQLNASLERIKNASPEELPDLVGDLTKDKEDIDKITTALEEQAAAQAEVVEQQKKIENAQAEADEAKAKLDGVTEEYEEQSKVVKKLAEDLEKLKNKTDFTDLKNALQKVFPGQEITQEMLTTQEGLDKLKIRLQAIDNYSLDKLYNEFKQMTGSAEAAKQLMQDLGLAVGQIDDNLSAVKDADREIERLTNNLKEFFSLGNSIQLFKRAVTSAMNTVKELDATMTEAAVVTDFSVGDMWNKLPTYADEAQKLGVSINGLYGATTLYYQQGLKTNEAMALGIETMKMARIAGMDAAKATKAMTAALRGFNMELNETSATQVNDVYSKLAAVTAADTNQIATAMSKTASIAASANMEFETTAALLAQIIETTQEAPETAGTAMKTIIARFSEVKSLQNKGEKTGKDAEGEDIDVNKIQTALRSVGISMNDFFAGTEGLDSVLMELAEKWDTLDFTTQRYIATTAAGSRQQSRFIAMMSDYARTTELVSAAQNSAGASQLQFNKTLDSMDAKLQQLENAWNEFLMGLANSEVLKAGVDFLTSLLSGINGIIDAMSFGSGPLKSVVSLLLTISTLKVGKGIFQGFINGLRDAQGTIKKSGTLAQQALGQDQKNAKDVNKSGKVTGENFIKGLVSALKKGKGKVKAAKDNLLSNDSKEETQGHGDSKKVAVKVRKKPQGVPSQADQSNSQGDNKEGGFLQKAATFLDSGREKTSQALGKASTEISGFAERTSAGFSKAGLAIMGVSTALGILAAKAEEAGNTDLAEGFNTAAGAAAVLGSVLTILPGIIQGVAVAIKFLSAALSTAGGAIGLILTVLAVVVTAFVAASMSAESESKKLEKQMDSLAKATSSFSSAAQEASNSSNQLKQSLEELSSTDPFEGLVEGTNQWNQALIENNQHILDLIDKYPQLADALVLEKGKLGLDEDKTQEIAQTMTENALKYSQAGVATSFEQQDLGIKLNLLEILGLEDADDSQFQALLGLTQEEFLQVLDELPSDFWGLDLREQKGTWIATVNNALGKKWTEDSYDVQTGNAVNFLTRQENGRTATEVKTSVSSILTEWRNLPQNKESSSEVALETLKPTIEGLDQVFGLIKADNELENYYEGIEAGKETYMENLQDPKKKAGIYVNYANERGDITSDQVQKLVSSGELTDEEIAYYLATSDQKDRIKGRVDEINNFLADYGDRSTAEALRRLFSEGSGALTYDDYKKLSTLNDTTKEELEKALNFSFDSFLTDEIKNLFSGETLKGATVALRRSQSEKESLFDTSSLQPFIDAATDSLSSEQKADFLFAMYDIDWSNKDEIAAFQKQMKELGYNIPETEMNELIKTMIGVGNATRKMNLDEVKETSKGVSKILSQLRSGEDKKTFSKEEYEAMIKSSPELLDNFVETLDGDYKLVDMTMQDLIEALSDNTKALVEQEVKELNAKSAAAAVMNKMGSRSFDRGQEKSAVEKFINQMNENNLQALGIEGLSKNLLDDEGKLRKDLEESEIMRIYNEINKIRTEGTASSYRQQANELQGTYDTYSAQSGAITVFDIFSYGIEKEENPSEDGENGNNQSSSGGAIGQAIQQTAQNPQDDPENQGKEAIEWTEKQEEAIMELADSYGVATHYKDAYYKAVASGQKEDILAAQTTLKNAVYRADANKKLEKTISTLKGLSEEYKHVQEGEIEYEEAARKYSQALGIDEDIVKEKFDVVQEAAAGNIEALQELYDLSNKKYGFTVNADGNFAPLEEGFFRMDAAAKQYLATQMELGNFKLVEVTADISGEYPVFKNGEMQMEWVQGGFTYTTLVYDESRLGEINTSGSKSGGSAPKKWENPYDEFYNSIEKINESLRTRERLEQRYQRLVNRNAASAAELANIQRDQLSLLEAERKEREYILRGRERQMSDIISEYSDVGKYAQWNQEKMRIEIDWNLLEKLDGSTDEKLTGRVEEFISKLEEQQKLIEEEKDSIESIEDTTWEIYSSGKDEYLDLEGQIKEALVNARQREIDELSEINNSINDANSAILDSMQKQIDQERQLRDNQKTEEEITNKENRLAYLRQDTSGANALEIMKLEKEINDQKQDYTDTLIDQKISELQEQNDLAAEQRERQIEIMQGQLDWYEKSQQVWNDVHTLMQTGLDLENNLIKGSDLETILKGENGFESMSQIEQMNWLNELESLVANGLKWLSNGAMQSLYGVGAEVNFVNADGQLITGKINSSGDVEAEGQIYSGKNFFMSTSGALTTTQTHKEASEAYKETITEPTPEPPTEPEEPSRTGWYFSKTGKRYSSRSEAVKAVYYWFNEEKVKLEFIAAKNKTAVSLGDIGALEQTRDRALASIRIHQFKTGGLADFTGPAWLDGTKSRPEYILNADQTKAFFSLVDVLSSLQSGSSKTTQNSGDNTYDIDINVESIGSDYDVERLADTVKRLINEDARYRNNNAINLMR